MSMLHDFHVECQYQSHITVASSYCMCNVQIFKHVIYPKPTPPTPPYPHVSNNTHLLIVHM